MPQVDNMEAVRILVQQRWELLNAQPVRNEQVVGITKDIVSLLPIGTEIAFLPNGDYVLKEENPVEQIFHMLKDLESTWKTFGDDLRDSILAHISPPASMIVKMPEDKDDRTKLENSRIMAMPLKNESTITFLPEIRPTVNVIYRYTFKGDCVKFIHGYNLPISIPNTGEIVRIDDIEYVVQGMRQAIVTLEGTDGKGNTMHEVTNTIILEEVN